MSSDNFVATVTVSMMITASKEDLAYQRAELLTQAVEKHLSLPKRPGRTERENARDVPPDHCPWRGHRHGRLAFPPCLYSPHLCNRCEHQTSAYRMRVHVMDCYPEIYGSTTCATCNRLVVASDATWSNGESWCKPCWDKLKD